MWNRRSVLYIQYTNPAAYPPLMHSAELLAEAGWRVVFLGTGALRSGALKGLEHPKVRWLQLPYCPPGMLQRLHYLFFSLCCLVVTLLVRPRWIYASDHLSCPVAWSLSFTPGLKILYHEHDAPSFSDGGRWGGILRAARAAVCQRASLVVTPNADRQLILPHLPHPRQIQVVANYPLRREVASSPRGPWSPPLRLIFEGSIGHKKLPLSLFEVLADLPQGVWLTVAGYVNPGSEEHMVACTRTVARLGLSERVRFRGLLQRRELAETILQHDVGLLLIDWSASPDQNLQTLVGASNKVYEYLAAGLPVIVPDTPAWHDAIVRRGLATACDASDPGSIGAAIRFFLDSPETMRQMGERGRCMIRDTWNYESGFRPVLERMEESLG